MHTVHHLTSHLESDFRYISYHPPFFSSIKQKALYYLPHKVVGRSHDQTDIECFADSWASNKLTRNVNCNYYHHLIDCRSFCCNAKLVPMNVSSPCPFQITLDLHFHLPFLPACLWLRLRLWAPKQTPGPGMAPIVPCLVIWYLNQYCRGQLELLEIHTVRWPEERAYFVHRHKWMASCWQCVCPARSPALSDHLRTLNSGRCYDFFCSFRIKIGEKNPRRGTN